MITLEQIPMVIDHPVYDPNGDKVGDVKHVFLDEATGQPEWLCVKSGLFGTKETFIPLQNADLVGDRVEVAYDKDRIKDAPDVDLRDDGYLSPDQEQVLYRHYDLDASWIQANQPGDAGWAHTAGQSERERLGRDTFTDTDGTATTTDGVIDDTTGGTVGGTARERFGVTGEAAGDAYDRSDDRAYDRADDATTRSEEPLQAGAETQTGRARLRRYVVTEQGEVSVPVAREDVRAEREPVAGEQTVAGDARKERMDAEDDEGDARRAF
ncbi:PRC-barrel domain-containing protein [Microbispora sp. NPDC049125]|uniref:PRC-barrel domain-containing protein n=1 Tax=Microbispora sp. NPDC049125 TaxID=3154929 RepID=UPI003467B0CF